jgi:tRNA1Val (adenine37-N6)-methyltransferase
MSNKPFVFKKFTINQDQCAMKIGTDGVLLGAWASIKKTPYSILDIGAGTGVLSIMLAQRSAAQLIDAIEIDARAYEQCVENFEQSLWADRLFCYHASLDEFVDEIEHRYDLIVCNPPFYSEDYKTSNQQRDLARFQDAMPFEHLAESVSKLLAKEGIFCVVVPFKEASSFIDIASKSNLFPNRIVHVKGNPSSEAKRNLIEFSLCAVPFGQQIETEITELIIETSRHSYTQEYTSLTKDFYLKM